ncbi:unnamed protein product [Effrenium voratum]|uniref:Uncharacterized protein n=1 Tax=Effrenium voratum TaxID=2562239 RepID=A0AA36JD02_9DINO|nr:unnamed protein product [Effrenium voratum]
MKRRSAQKQENSKTKALDMLWCLYEAMRLKDEEFLTQPGVVIALHRDERNRVIQCDFTAASSDLSTRSGVLHCAFNQGGAAGVLQGTKEIVRAALTSLDKQVKHGSENALRKAVELVCIDAAPDEVAASNEGHRPSFQDLQPYTPNLLIARSYKASDFLDQLFRSFVWDKASLVQRIENSPIFKMWFQECQPYARATLDARVRSLKAAKHRMASHEKPLCRLVLYIEPLIHVALRIRAERSQEDVSHDASRFLAALSAESYLQLALLADAAVEVGDLLRVADAGAGMNTAELITCVQDFEKRISYLFLHGGVFSSSGFTAWALHVLRQRYSFAVAGTQREFGGPQLPGEAVKERCLRRMQAWHKVVNSVLHAVFPDWELAAAFHVIFASRCSEASAGFGPAWAQAVWHAQKLGRPVAALQACLQRYLAFAISTCGLERRFSRQAWSFGKSADHQSLALHVAKAKLLTDYQAAEEDAIIQKAQEVWMQRHSPARESTGPRFHKGQRQGPRKGRTLAGFLRRRREAVSEGCKAAGAALSTDPLPADMLGDFWTEKHAEEVAFQQQKQVRLAQEAHELGALLPGDVPDEVLDAAPEAERRRQANARQRARQTSKRAAALQGALPDLTGRVVFVPPGMPSLQRLASERGFQLTDRRAQATVFLAESLESMSERTWAAAVLCGGSVMTWDTLQEMQGPCVSWQKALDTRRRVYWTQAAQKHSPQLHQLVVEMAKTARRWKMLDGQEDFEQQKVEAAARKQSPAVLAVTRPSEKKGLLEVLVARGAKGQRSTLSTHIQTPKEFFQFIAKQDPQRCCTGVCGY